MTESFLDCPLEQPSFSILSVSTVTTTPGGISRRLIQKDKMIAFYQEEI